MAIAAPLLIQVGAAAGVAVASHFLTPKPKLSPVDRGRFDDIRFQTAEEGSFKPLCFGKRVRLAGNLMWGTVTKEFVTRTEGRSGGKGGGGGSRPPEPPTNTFTYKKSFAILICASPLRSVRRISENTETIFSNVGSNVTEGFYEAELGTPGGGATVVTDGQFSNGRAVRLAAAGQFVELQISSAFAGLHTGSLFYKAAGATQVFVSANGGSETALNLPASSGVPGAVSFTLTLARGTNTIKIRHSTGTTDVDRIYLSGVGVAPPTGPTIPGGPIMPREPIFQREITNVIDLDNPFPADPDNPTPYYNVVQGFDANGYFEGHMTAGGQARFELFAGKETQPQSAIIVTREGASKTPAFRDDAYFVTEDYLVKNGQLGNFVFEVEPDIQELDDILLYLYTLDERVTAADCDFSALSGLTPEGFILDHRAPLEDWVTSLETWFDFDVTMRGGKITAVRRGGAVVTRIYEKELRAHFYGEQRPRAAVKIEREDPTDLPNAVDVIYLDPSPSKDFHTGNQVAQKAVGFAFDVETLSFPVVSDADTAHAVGLKYLDGRHLSKDAGTLVCGFGKRYLIPSDILEVELEDATLHTYRIVSKQADLQSMVKFGVLPDRPSVYTQNGYGTRGRGGDVIVIRPPANSHLVQADIPPLRTADRHLLGRYMGTCSRAGGSWAGAGLYKENDAGVYVRVTAFDTEAVAGVAVTALPTWTDPDTTDATSTLDVGLFNGSLESITDSEFANNPELNVLVVVKADGAGEIIRYKTVTPLTLVAGEPYEWKGRLSVFKRGFNHTIHAATGHAAGDGVLMVDTAVKFVQEPVEELDRSRNWKAVSSGIALADATEKLTTLRGYSYRPPEVRRFTGQRHSVTNDVFLAWEPFELGERQQYALRFYAPSGTVPVRTADIITNGAEPLLFTRDNLLGDGTPITSAGTCSTISGVATDGSYTVSTTGIAAGECRYVSQEIRGGNCIIQFEADARATPRSIQTVGAAPRPCVIDPVADTVKITNNDLQIYDGQQCQFRLVGGGAALPAGVANQNAAYYVIHYDGKDTFKVSMTPGGSPLNFTSAGSGVRAHVISGLTLLNTVAGGGGGYDMEPEASAFYKRPVVAGQAYAMEILARTGRYFLPYTGDATIPTMVAASIAIPDPFRVSAALGFLGGVAQAMVRPRVVYRHPHAFTYSKAMQDTDFNFSPPATVNCEIRQVVHIGNTRIEGLARYVVV